MRFDEKIVFLRKNKKMSQEQLADKLNVSRQAVSKWESGVSYPEMDKLIEMCKIFDCTLDDLTNDKISIQEISSHKQKNSLNDFVNEVGKYINKSFNMFKQMSGKKIFSMILFMLLIFFLIFLCQLPVKAIYVLGEHFFYNFGDKVGVILSSFWQLILGLIYVVGAIMLFFFIYKIKYLDKFDEIKVETDGKEIMVKEENKVDQKLIKDNSNGNNFFKVLCNIFKFFVKCFLIFFSIPFIFAYIFIIFALFISIYLIINGVIFWGIILLLLAGIILITLLFELLFDFVFNKPINNKTKIFLLLITGFVLLGIGFGVATIEASKYTIKHQAPSYYTAETYVNTIDFNKDLYFYNQYKLEYVADNNLKDKLKIEIKYYRAFSKPTIINNNNAIYINYADDEFSMDFIKSFIKDLKTKTIYDYSTLRDYKITVYTSSANIDILKNNYLNQEIENETKYVETLQNEINDLQNINYQLREELGQVRNSFEDCQDQIEEYKERIQSIIEE